MTCRTVKGGLSANGGGGIWSPWVASDRPVDRIESACASPHTSPAVLSGLLRPAAGRTRLRAGGGDLAAGRQRLRPEAATLLQAGGSDPSVGRWRLSRGEPPAGLRRRPPLTARPEVGRRWRPGCGLAAGSWLRAGSSDPHVGRRVANRLRAGGCDPPAVRLRRRPGSGWAVDRDGWRM